jgi:hypothetical protein
LAEGNSRPGSRKSSGNPVVRRRGGMLGTSRGQIWSLDFTSGVTLLSIMILLFVLEWNYLALRWNTSLSYRDILSKAIYASDALFTTPGDPQGWERIANITGGNVSAIGLVNSRNMLDNQKLGKLMAMNASQNDYNLVLSKLGLSGCQMHLTISDLMDNVTYYDYGRPSGLNNSAVADRFALLNNSIIVKAKLEVWR